MYDNDIGDWIKKSRLRYGWTQAEVAGKIGVNIGVVSHWERGTRQPNTENRKSLEDLLGPIDTAIDFDGEFGRWLNQEIEKQNISRNELSQKSGVHPVTIDNLIRGRTENPHSETMRKLAGALGHSEKESVGSEVIEETERSKEIPGLGSFEGFSPYVKGEIPDCAGIYVLYDVTDRPVYVGQTKEISRRIKEHHDKFWFKLPIVEKGAYIEVPDKDLRVKLEKFLIKFLKNIAVINKHHADR